MSHPKTSALRVGSVPYLVGRPLDQGLGDEPGIELHHAVPALLIDQLRAGEIDVALVSSIELFRTPGYRYIDGIGVAGESYVGSVQVFLRKPIQEVRSIAMDPSSRAAAALTRTLLHERAGRRDMKRSRSATTRGSWRARTPGSVSVTRPCARR